MGPNTSQIGQWLHAMRKKHGAFSQEGAAHHVGTTARTLWTWEHGKAAPPADQFFALVLLYEAESELPSLIGKRQEFHTPRGSPAGTKR